MSVQVKIPAVGESIASGVVSVWHKKNGERVAKGDPLFTLETDKVSTEIVAEIDGVLETKVDEGQEVKIGEIVAVINDSAAGADAPAASAPKEEKKQAEKAAGSPEALSPAVRRVVEEEKVDASKISGTGKDGRVTKGDALSAAKNRTEPGAESSESVPAAAPEVDADEHQETYGGDDSRVTRKRMSPLRRKIAQQLVMAQHTAAILTTFNECDMSEVQHLRAKVQDDFVKKNGFKLGFMSFFIKATIAALKAVPSINNRIEGDDFVQNNFFDIGVAVGTERGLVVPIVRDADKKSFADLERDIAGFAQKAREGKLKIEELTGGTFTISNGGVYGSLLSTPILNPPQSGILGMHKIMERPIAINGAVVVRPMMYLALSYDHRAVDGKEAVTFLIKVKEGIESPKTLPIDF
ncbi:MAG: 2-oxoglutarate dehydrogenase complex dihydrolipoyllysine-residue succinyltransferase [Verrucomicrobiota bacterium]|nr:2-oxoglutarate dehydrogenase complex dihydrolipoyllysine-residue succinyltransferase [Verrucomicrobiota bacterium]